MPQLRPCVLCGELTRCFFHQETADRSQRRVFVCPECIGIWQWNRQARQLLLSSRGCLEGATIRHLLRPPPTKPPAARAAAKSRVSVITPGKPSPPSRSRKSSDLA